MTFKVEMIPGHLISPAAYNPRRKLRRGDKEWDDIAGSIREFGLVENLVWNRTTGNLVGGHQRMQVMATDFGTTEFPCVVVELDDTAERRLNIMLNRVGEKLWDHGKLAEVIQGLDAITGTDLYALGFDPPEIEELLGKPKASTKSDPDDIPGMGEDRKPLTRPGDRYQFISNDGEPCHWLVCGEPERLPMDALMNGAQARMIFTTPPATVHTAQEGKTPKKPKKLADLELAEHVLAEFLTEAFRAASSQLMKSAAVYVWHPSNGQAPFESAMTAAGFKILQQLIWIRQIQLAKDNYHPTHLPCLYASHGPAAPWFGDRTQATALMDEGAPHFEGMKKAEMLAILKDLHRQSSVMRARKTTDSEFYHPDSKPVALIGRCLDNSTIRGDNVLDPFGHTGSTLIACEMHGRNAFLMEASPSNCDAIVARYLSTFEHVAVTRNGNEVHLNDYLPQQDEL